MGNVFSIGRPGRRIVRSIAAVLLCCLSVPLSLRGGNDRRILKIALVQAELAWGDPQANLEAFEKRIGKCRGADVIVFPELFVSGCRMKPARKPEASSEPLSRPPRLSRTAVPGTDGLSVPVTEAVREKQRIAALYPAVLERMKRWAARSGALVMGSTIYQEGERFYNRLLAVRPDGSYEYYDKHNCFKKGSFSPGQRHVVVVWKGVRLALYICYDLRFPEWSRNGGRYDAAVYIANWPASRRKDWICLLRERAVENRSAVIGVNCAGEDPDGLYYAGDSSVYAPDGTLQGCCREGREHILRLRLRIP